MRRTDGCAALRASREASVAPAGPAMDGHYFIEHGDD